MIERENRVLELIRSELYPIDDNKNALLANIHKLHTTELGIERIRRNLQLQNENLVRESFWNVYRPGCLEHYVLNQLRTDEAFVPELDFVMEKDGKLIGQNMFMRAKICQRVRNSLSWPAGGRRCFFLSVQGTDSGLLRWCYRRICHASGVLCG